jgi:integrase
MARRASNEGSIFQRQDGRWAGSLTLGYVGGKRKRKTFYGATQREVREKLTAARHTQQQGVPLANERQTTGQFLAKWLEESAKPTIRLKTYASYRQLIALHLVPELGRIPLAKLSPQQVQEFLNRKLASGLSPRTVQYLHALLRAALNRAMKWGLVARNVATLVDAPRVRRPDIAAMPPQQARALLAAVRGDRLEALYTVALAVGLRLGEALGLLWPAIDLENGTLTVRTALQRLNGTLQLVEPKSASSRRTIALPQVAIEALRAHRTRQLEERLLAGERWQENGLVFTTAEGKPLDARNVFRGFQRLLTRAGLPHLRLHDLRHGCATLLIAQGVHPRTIMEILGHSQISLTMNTYGHVTHALQRDAAARVDAVFATDLR